jgi:DNA-binding CsgD family transcriptional regulator
MNIVEREDELAILQELLVECLDSRGKIAVIDGPAAAGKTTLLRFFAEKAADSGALFLHTTGTYAECGVPLGVIRKLLGRAGSLPGVGTQAMQMLDEDMSSAAFDKARGGDHGVDRMTASVRQRLCAMLFRAAETTPIVVAVDDAHNADEASLQCLLYLAHRLKSARIMLVLAERATHAPEHPLFHAELLSLPHCGRVRLKLLSQRAQTRLLAERFGARAATRLAPVCHALTGGNPLLVRSLLRDSAGPGRDGPRDLVMENAFTRSVLGILHRGGPAMPSVARALAVLGRPTPPALLGRMLGLGAEQVAQVLEAMRTAGLLDGNSFRHPAVGTAALDSIPPDERAALHGRAARLLHEDGATAVTVAAHLVASDAAEPPWAATVLEEAAEQAIADHEPQLALACLRLAHRTYADQREQVRITCALARVEWRTDPVVAGRLLPGLVAAAREGRLTDQQLLTLARHLMWSGQAAETTDVLRRSTATARPAPDTLARELAATRLMVAAACPGVADGLVLPDDADLVSTAASGMLRMAAALSSTLAGRADGDVADVAEQTLEGTRLTERSLGYVVAAVGVLVYAEHPARAERWCDSFLKEAASLRAPTWHAILAAAYAMVAARQGDLAAAESHARTALSRISPVGWGNAIGLPISVTVLAATAMGRFEDAAAHLGIAVPEDMFETLCGLHYLHARGRYRLATGNPRAALADFRTCGDLMTRWGCDIPGLVPWRAEAAQALLALGERDQAVRLVDEQLALAGSEPSGTRGACLRLRAMTAEPARRPALLNAAVRVLEHSDDRYELVLALSDLSRAQHAVGEHDQARVTAHAARRLAGQCGVPWPRTAPLDTAPGDDGTRPALGPDLGLTEAELKVAELAAEGRTNREIAGTLLITVSTVEQHLTKVYRKLDVNQRSELRRLRWPADSCAPDKG